MAELGSPTPLSMGFANIPAEQPVQAAANLVTPFKAVDEMGQTQKAYDLASTMGKYQDEQAIRQDQTKIQEYMKQGGNMSTPEGIQKAITDLQGHLSPKSWASLMKQGEASLGWNEKLNDYYTKLPEDAFKLQSMKTEYTLKGLEGPLQAYAESAKTKGEPAALQDFEAARTATINYASQLKDAAGKPIFTAQDLEPMKTATPAQLQAQLSTAKFHQDRLKEAAELKVKEAQAREHNAKADMMEQGGPALYAYNMAVEQYGEDSPQAKALLAKALGASAMSKAAGMPEEDVSNDVRKLVVSQWIQNPSSLRGYDKTYQQRVANWAAAMGITPEDIASGQALRKFSLAAAGAAGNRSGTMAAVEATMPGLVNEAIDASSKVPRGNFLGWNKLMQMADTQLSDPNLKRLKVANQAIASEFQQVISRGGSNVTALNEAMHLLQTAESPEAYAAALKQIQREVQINVQGAEKVRESLRPKHGPNSAKEGEYSDKDKAYFEAQLRGQEARLKDTLPGSATYKEIESDINELKRTLGGAGKPAGDTAPMTAPAAAAPQMPKVGSPAELKSLVKDKKLKVGDKFIGPDGAERVLKKLPE